MRLVRERSRLGTSILLFAVACTLGATPTGAQAPKVIAGYTKGQIGFTQGRKSYTLPLTSGELQSMTLTTGGKSTEVRILSLSYGVTQTAAITLSNIAGPGRYENLSIVAFSVFTGQDRQSFWSARKGSCTFDLRRVDERGVEGTAACTGDMDDGRGGKGLPVTGVKFSAAP